MSVKMISMVWQDTDVIDPTHTLILLALADYANDEGVCWPGWDKIGKKARCSRSTVWRIVKALISSKKITVESGGGKHKTNTYRLTLKPYQDETVSNLKPSHRETKPSHPETQTVSSYETRSVSTRHDPPKDGNRAAHKPGNNGVTPKDKFWMNNELLKTASGPAKKKLEAEREAAYSASTGVVLPKIKKPVPITTPEPATPTADPALVEKLIAEAKQTVDSVIPAKPVKAVTKQLRFKRPPPLPPQNPHPV